MGDLLPVHKRLFYNFAVKNEDASATQGRDIYEDKEFIEIRVPGDRNLIIQRAVQRGGPALLDDTKRFAAHYKAFKDGVSDDVVVGTPLAVFPGITPAQREELAYFKVRTVEHLADLKDDVASGAHFHALKQRAKDYIKTAAGLAPVTAVRAELEEERKRMRSLEQQVEDLKKALKRTSKE
jgi:hypothetical protein